MKRRFLGYLLMVWTIALAGCSGTIQRESKSGAAAIQGGTFRTVEVVLSDSARKLQGENVQFNVRELSEYVRRRLEAEDLLRLDGEYRVEVTVDNFRVRSAAAAVLFGIMAGTDSIDGSVKVFDKRDRQVHAYKVAASYGLGGWAGGQDGMRMNWLYEKFSQLAVAELVGTANVARTSSPRPVQSSKPTSSVVIAPSGSSLPLPAQGLEGAATAEPIAKVAPTGGWTPNAELRAAHPPSNFAKLEDVEAVPVISNACRERYRSWLVGANPKAYAIGKSGRCGYSSGIRPPSKDLPIDPAERALAACARGGKDDCKLYAIDDSVVWKP